MNRVKTSKGWIDLDDLKRHVDLTALFGDGKVLCPWHTDSNPSCHVYPDHVYCFSCGKAGDAITFVCDYMKLTFSEALDFLIANKGKRVTKEISPSTVLPDDYVQRTVAALEDSPEAQQYLINRGLHPEIRGLLSLGLADDYISIPHFANGKLVNVKYRCLLPDVRPKYTSLEGAKFEFLYPYDFVTKYRNSKELLLTEGEFDAMLLLQEGYTAMSLPSGVNTDLWQWAAYLKRYEEVYLLFDQDEAGAKAITKVFSETNKLNKTLAETLLPTNLFRIGWSPRYGKDVTEAREYLLPKLLTYLR